MINGVGGWAIGRLGRDAELRYTQSGTPMLTFSIAVFDAKRAEDAPTEWLSVVCWGDQAKALEGKLVKGVEVYVEGRNKLDTYQKDGTDRTTMRLSAWTVQPMGAPRAEKVGA